MAMIEAVQREENQYIRVAGHPKLCNEISEKYTSVYNRKNLLYFIFLILLIIFFLNL